MNQLTAIENNSPKAIASSSNDWHTRHDNAANPKIGSTRTERSITGLISAWQEYAEAYKQKYEGDLIGNDGYAGNCWQSIGAQLVHLLSMDHGMRLDGGTLDSAIRSIAKNHGIEGEL